MTERQVILLEQTITWLDSEASKHRTDTFVHIDEFCQRFDINGSELLWLVSTLNRASADLSQRVLDAGDLTVR